MSHKTEEELIQKLNEAKSKVIVDAVYYHYKDTSRSHPYKIVAIALDENTEESRVVYQNMEHEELIWIRAVEDFLDDVEVEGKMLKRFSL